MTKRTHTCGSLTINDVNKKVLLKGWVQKNRNLGSLQFIDLRDRFGVTQILIDPQVTPELHKLSAKFRGEWVLEIHGTVRPRASGMHNKNLLTGEIEVHAEEILVISEAKTPPIEINEQTDNVNEKTRLENRCLDMRRGKILNNLVLRHKTQMAVRNFLDKQAFIDVQTPILGKSTPETGAKDYLVPSRLYKGSVFALPQSPQIYKQLLMVAGLDRYFQIAPCFRDEDLRADRQPEFTQIDMEMSFCTTEDLFEIIEGLVSHIFKEIKGITLPAHFPRMTYRDAVEKYGTDKPDTRFGLPLVRIHESAKLTSAPFFHQVLENAGAIKALVVPGKADYARKTLDEYTALVKKFKATGLGFLKSTEEGIKGSLAKFFDEHALNHLIKAVNLKQNDIVFIIAEEESVTNQALDHLRRHIAREENLIPLDCYDFTWITEFPLFHKNEEDNSMESEHHPFTAPLKEDLHLLETAPYKMRAAAYDLVAQGYEVGGGSNRIYDPVLQKKIFETLKLSEEEINARFGFFLKNFQYGTPPHLGIALGLDRLLMILAKTDNIRDVIAFPKTTQAQDLLTNSPSLIDEATLKTLHLKNI
jgi:aspartyl-tRNA synthetase